MAKRKPKRNIAEEQDGQIRILHDLLDEARNETAELERVKAELTGALTELQAFRNEHREREAEIASLIRRTTLIADERAHLVIAGNELLRNVRYMWRQCDRIVQGQRG
jgi:hypothetical protein